MEQYRTSPLKALLTALLLGSLMTAGLGGCTHKGPTQPSPSPSAVAAEPVYTCPMHPQIRQKTPGRCPICGMDLVLSKTTTPEPVESPVAGHATDHSPFNLSQGREQLIGVKTGKVEKRELFREIRAPGRVAFDPELYTAQTEYLEALNQLERVKDSPLPDVKHSAMRMVESAKLRLKILGLSDNQIAALPKNERTEPSLLLHKAGEDVWVYAEVFEMDLPYVKPGLTAKISANFLEGQDLTGKVISVDRVLNTTTRTAKVRISVPKANLTLRPETFVDATIEVPLGPQLAIPFDAVLDTGKQSLVFVRKTDPSGNVTYEPRPITIRATVGDWVAVEKGLSEGETIVTSANFMVDSESRLRAAATGGSEGSAPSKPSCPADQYWDAGMAMCMPNPPGAGEKTGGKK